MHNPTPSTASIDEVVLVTQLVRGGGEETRFVASLFPNTRFRLTGPIDYEKKL